MLLLPTDTHFTPDYKGKTDTCISTIALLSLWAALLGVCAVHHL